MTDLLQKIIEVDKAARKRLEDAQNERAAAYAAVEAKKQDLIREEKQKAQKKTEKIGDEHKAAREKQLADVREQNKIILERMNSLYAEKKEEWVSQIVDGVLSSREV